MASYQIHVVGPCPLTLDGTLCGYSVDGFTITFNLYYEDVFSDVFGPKVPSDVQQFLEDAEIDGEVIVYDIDTLESWISPWAANGAFGEIGAAGDLMLQNEWAGNIILGAAPGLTDVEHCWNFPNAWTLNAGANYGTRRTTYKMKFRAVPTFSADGSAGQTLFTTSCS